MLTDQFYTQLNSSDPSCLLLFPAFLLHLLTSSTLCRVCLIVEKNMRSSESGPRAPETPPSQKKLSGVCIPQLCHRREPQSASASVAVGMSLRCWLRLWKAKGKVQESCVQAVVTWVHPQAGSSEAKADGRSFALAAICRNGHHFYKIELYHIRR